MKLNRRLGALVAVSALSLSGVALVASPAHAADDPLPRQQAASWLIGQVGPNGIYYNALYDFDDYGLGADTAISLDAIGGHDATVTKLGNALRDNYYNFVTGGSFGPDDLYGGSMGKALVVAQVAGTKPDGYAARVQSDIEDLLGDAAPIAGRIQNDASFDANVFGQAYVARGLAVAGSTDYENAVSYLLLQQCADGFFRQSFGPKTGDQTCDAGDAGTYGDRIGATATAVINLQAVAGLQGLDPTIADDITAAIGDAQDWLVAQQGDDGSWGDGNANNTGLAAWALGSTNDAEVIEAAQWLRSHQADDTDTCTGFGAAGIGAVALNQDAFEQARSEGVTVQTAGEFQRATSQSLVALGRVPAPTATANLTLSGPTGYVQGGKPAVLKVTGALPGSRVCVENLGKGAVGTANASGVATVQVVLPNITSTRNLRATDAAGTTTTTSVKVLGPKVLKVTPAAKRVKKGKAVRVTVTGLAAGERVTLRYRGRVVATGTATSAGVFARKVAVGRKTGAAVLAAYGQFPTVRKGAANVRVVR